MGPQVFCGHPFSPHEHSVARPTSNENYLVVIAIAPQKKSPLLQLTRRVGDSGCHLLESRLSTLGDDVAINLLLMGSWDAIAKFETAAPRIEREEGIRLILQRTAAKETQTTMLPYLVEVVAADKPGILHLLAEFFIDHGISIESLTSNRYRAMQTGAEMFSAQITIGIPAKTHIASLRDAFLEFCDAQNLDAIMDPMKF